MPTVHAKDLQPIIADILEAAGGLREYAEIVAAHLVSANLSGHDSHGVLRAPNYVNYIDTNRLDPTAVPAVTDETATIAQIDGGNTFGQVTAKMATELAISKAREQGVALVTMYRIGHTGRLGTYAEMAAEAGMACVLWDGVIGGNRSIVIPLNGSGRKIGANPIAMGFPSEKHNAVVLDFATSMSAAGKVSVAEAKGVPLPGEWIVDAEGRPTDDPTQLNKGGALRPMGLPDVGHKGYALAMMTGLFTMMASMPSGAEMPHEDRWGTVILMVDISRFGPTDLFKKQVDVAIDYVKTDPLGGEVLYPGEIETRHRAERLANGIDLPEPTWREIIACVERFGLAPPA